MPSRQHVYGGGKFRSERQRRAIWANSPTLGHLWAHNMDASGHKRDWNKVRRGAATHTGHSLSAPALATKSIGMQVRMGTRPRAGANATAPPRRFTRPARGRQPSYKGRRVKPGGKGSFTRRGPRRR